jgi:hypothetical protein
MFAPVLMSENDALRIGLNVSLLVGVGWLFFTSGAGRGESDAASDALRKKSGVETDALFYSRRRTALGALIGAAPWILLGAAVAILAVPYTYSLQDLPPWLGSYMRQPDIGNALAYYDREVVVPIIDWLRMALRFALLPYVYLLAAGGDAASYHFDKLSFLPPLIMPALYSAGYLLGPAQYAKTSKYIEQVKSKPRLRLKKSAVRKRAQKQPDGERNRLI